MAPRRTPISAGIVCYRHGTNSLEVLLVHPGGPFWRNKDDGAWSIPKGELEDGETAEAVARREFQEETGAQLPGPLEALEGVKQKGGKYVHAFACEGDVDSDAIVSNTFELEWPPKSGRYQSFPEVDRAGWFSPAAARQKILASQAPLLDQLEALLHQRGSGG